MDFREQVERGLGAVVILAGSKSDEEHVRKIADALGKYDIPYEVRIASAHKEPEEVLGLVKEYDGMNMPLAYVAVAGMTDALSGMISFHSLRPVISCPPDAPNTTCLTNPPGSSNVTVYHPSNAAKFIAQMFSHLNPAYAEAILHEKDKKLSELVVADRKLRTEITGGQK
jgi:phosphoribosylaminoimidazole carboxylase PurE protein